MGAAKKRLVEADLEKLARNPHTTYRDGSNGVNLPFDVPIYARCFRVMRPEPDHDPRGERGGIVNSEALVGWRTELEMFTYGVKVIVKIDRETQAMTIVVEDDEGQEEVGTWTK